LEIVQIAGNAGFSNLQSTIRRAQELVMIWRNSVAPNRRAVVLLLVLMLLTLFAVVGISFVLYANAAATAAQLHRESESLSKPDVDPELLFAYFLGQLIYDVPDDERGAYSALRGHSLARSIYGSNDTPGCANILPFNGVGRLHTATNSFGQSIYDDQLINHTYYPADGVHDPERLGWRTSLSAARGPYTGGLNAPYTYPDLNSTFLVAVRADGVVLLPSFYRPWASQAADVSGEFYRPDTGQLNSVWSPTATPPPWLKYTTLRPLPALNPGFPPPEDGGGDVKNLIGGPGTFRRMNGTALECWGNDSFWIDLDFPVLTAPDGRRYKPLFAPLIVDLDNRVNLNVHGNIRGRDMTGRPMHVSNQGFGPWEVNLGQVLSRDGEWQALFSGTATPPLLGRYGGTPWTGDPGPIPSQTAPTPSHIRPHFYGQVDFDACQEQAGFVPTLPLQLPGAGTLRWCFPSYPAGYGNRSVAERRGHAALYNVIQPVAGTRAFRVSNMEALLRYGDTGSPALTSELLRLCPSNFADSRIRRLVTTHSFDLDRPGVAPWVHFADTGSTYEVEATADPDKPELPKGPPIPFPRDRGRPPFDPRQADGEFGNMDWRAVSAALGRIDLNRPLPPYPHMGSGQTPPFGPPLTIRNNQIVLDMPFNVDAPDGPIWKQFLLAQAARQRLANDIYRRLLIITGVPPIRPEQRPREPEPSLLRCRRWLAQLAVNIVDFIDEDDISTPFCFYTSEDYQHLPVPPRRPPDPSRVSDRPEGMEGEIQWPLYWVFGTELPRIVVNEALAESRRHDPNEAYTDIVRVFVELHNTFPRSLPLGVHLPDSFPIPLRMNGTRRAGPYTPYRVMIAAKSKTTSSGEDVIAGIQPGIDNDNVLGNPAFSNDPDHPNWNAVRTTTTDSDFLGPLPTAGGDEQPIWPGSPRSGRYGPIASPYMPAHGLEADGLPQGFLLLGPPSIPGGGLRRYDAFRRFDPFDGPNAMSIPASTPMMRKGSLQYIRDFESPDPDSPPDERTTGITVLLRRLANPYLPFDGRRRLDDGQANPTYNPFVTVDYLEGIPLQAVSGLGTIASQGKLQPYAAHQTQWRARRTQAGENVRHTFGRQNYPATEQFDWLTHLDRALISPMELVHVSGYQPYQLTQRFIFQNRLDRASPITKFGHRAPWLDEDFPPSFGSPRQWSHRLYRLLEFVETGPQAAGVAAGGRIPGKININTVWDAAILQALCDAGPSNQFTDDQIKNGLFPQLLQSRTSRPDGVPDRDDRPFLSTATGLTPIQESGQYPKGISVDDTILRPAPDLSKGLFEVPDQAHPYLRQELLTKIFNHITTRSNVFAVWLTVGFFEVTDESTRPVKLGAEIGRAESRHIRHRMFAVVDRSNLSIASCVTTLVRPIRPSAEPQKALLQALSGILPLPGVPSGIAWTIEAGTTLLVGTGADQESVKVLAVNPQAQLPTISALFTKPHNAGAPISLAHNPGIPPIFLKPISVAPDSLLQPPYLMTVQIAVDPTRSNTRTLSGEYDGIPWEIQRGTNLLIDVGPDQEAVTVEGVILDPVTATGSFQVRVAKLHAADFLITNTLLGNPGPRPRFNPRDPVYSAMVRYFSIID
jgi:hypothetical protein